MTHAPVRLAELRRACAGRTLEQLCLPRRLPQAEWHEIEGRVGSWLLEKNEHLYHTGDRLSAFYVVRAGSLQAHLGGPVEVPQVLGFYLPGEVAGLGALQDGRHMTECIALETSVVCAIPSYRLEELCALLPRFACQVRRLMDRAVCGDHRLLLSLGRLEQEQRLAAFLLDLARRHIRPGCSPRRFRLPMGHVQIAGFLGTSPESISRAFTNLGEAGMLNFQGEEIHLLNLPGLADLCGMPARLRHVLAIR